jgi:hypothetical protein
MPKADYRYSFQRGYFKHLLWMPTIYSFTRHYIRHSHKKTIRTLRIGWLWWGAEFKSTRVERLR